MRFSVALFLITTSAFGATKVNVRVACCPVQIERKNAAATKQPSPGFNADQDYLRKSGTVFPYHADARATVKKNRLILLLPPMSPSLPAGGLLVNDSSYIAPDVATRLRIRASQKLKPGRYHLDPVSKKPFGRRERSITIPLE